MNLFHFSPFVAPISRQRRHRRRRRPMEPRETQRSIQNKSVGRTDFQIGQPAQAGTHPTPPPSQPRTLRPPLPTANFRREKKFWRFLRLRNRRQFLTKIKKIVFGRICRFGRKNELFEQVFFGQTSKLLGKT